MSESDKSGKPEITAKRAAVEIVGIALSRKIDEVEALKARIAELEAAIPQLIMIIDQSGVDLLKSEIELIKSLKPKP